MREQLLKSDIDAEIHYRKKNPYSIWKKINKNPQKNQTNYVDWIELIKFRETRNYVQRVLENYNVYRYILAQEPIEIKDFFKNDPLY